jgi:hypothetical protein
LQLKQAVALLASTNPNAKFGTLVVAAAIVHEVSFFIRKDTTLKQAGRCRPAAQTVSSRART